MEAETKQKIQILLVVLLMIVAARTAYIFYDRAHPDEPQNQPVVENRTIDDYVYIKPLHVTDLESARTLNGKELWIKAGNVLAFYPVTGDQVNNSKMLGVVPPLAKVKVKRVMMSGDQVMALVQPESATGILESFNGKTVAIPIGAARHGDYRMMTDEIFYLEDPHVLYKHWSPTTWDAINKGQPLKGMSEIQAAMALGVGRATSRNSDYGNRTLEYSIPLELGEKAKQRVIDLTFVNNKVITIDEQKSEQK